MRTNVKKMIGCMLTATMAMGMLTGCGSSKSNSSSTDTSSNSSADNGKTVEISVMAWDRGTAAPGTSNEDNALTKWIQEQVLEQCNVKVKYVAVPRSGSDDKLNVMMAGGSAPDVVFSYSQDMFGNYASSDGLADLTDALAKNGDIINSKIGDIQYMGQYDGKQYAIMKRRGFQIPRHVCYVRSDWCKALGMEIPTTKEQLFDYLYAVKDKNPGGVANVVPWGMGGTTDTEKFYLNFVGSYVPSSLSEKDSFIYSENFIVFADGAIDGLKQLNKLYNDGLISKDFAVDTTCDQFKQDVCAGNVGFMLDDSTNYFDYAPTLQSAVAGAEFVPVNCFDLDDGSYRNPTEPLYGMYIMVPKSSQDKADAVVKYLNWLADPTNAENVACSPEHTRNDAGVPIWFTQDELNAKGYPGNCGDYCIVNDHLDYVEQKESMVSSWSSSNTWETEDWFSSLYDVCTTNQFLYPTVPDVLESEATYKANLKSAIIEYVYKLISCPTADFDTTQASEYKKLVDAGLEKIIEERGTYYDANMAK